MSPTPTDRSPSPDALAAARPTGRLVSLGPVTLITSTRTIWVTAALAACAALLGAVGMTAGSLPLSLAQVVGALWGGMTGADGDDIPSRVVLGLRLPRVVTAMFAGAALGLSGAVFQSVSRNALGSPEIIGFTTGAATGAIMQIIVFRAGPVQVAAGAVVGGMVTAVVVYALAVKNGVSGGYRLVLVGIGVGAILQAVNSLLLVMGDLDTAVAANIWLAGSLEARDWEHAVPVAVGVMIAIPVLLGIGRRATLIEMGDDTASQLGVRVERTRLSMMFVGVVLAGLATGAAGPIAFIALAAPQLAARLSGVTGMPVVTAAAMGAALLVLADTLTQSVPFLAAAPIGKVTAVVGGLYLIWLLTRSRQL